MRVFSPHVSVLASQDTEELVRHKGVHGGLLELLRPFGEHVPGKVTIRDSAGASKSWEDFAVRFIGVKDGMENPRTGAQTSNSRNSMDASASFTKNAARTSGIQEYKPARLRTGGDIAQIEELVERHLTFAEEQSGPFHSEEQADYINHKDADKSTTTMPNDPSPFYTLYLRRLLSGLPLVPSETLSHPIASVIAISSRSAAPIEDLRTLYASSNTGEHRLPHWVHNEFLRYYLLIHDEDYDDLNKSMQLYEQMKRHFGLHCHLLRLRSQACSPSRPTSPTSAAEDDSNNHDGADKVRLPLPTWLSAAEELAEITRRETSEDDHDIDLLTPYIFATDATNIRAFVREMVTQSIIPSMERASANWNDQVASRRRGISGRFMSLSKRFTGFGTSGSRNSSMPTSGVGGVGSNNYDSLQGFYRPDAPEAVMRRLADYAMMLRDFKLARGVYELLCTDFKNDKAWRYYAGANEMGAIAALIVATSTPSSAATSAAATIRGGRAAATDPMIEQFLETAYYSYITRVGAPYYALRTLVLAIELLKIRGGGRELDDAAKWAQRCLEDRLVGPIGHVLLMERIGACYDTDRKAVGGEWKKRRRAAFWNMLSTDAWLRLEKGRQAEKCLREAEKLYGLAEGEIRFQEMDGFLRQLQDAVSANRAGPQHLGGEDLLFGDEVVPMVEPLQDESERLGLTRRASLGGGAVPTISNPMHRKSVSVNNAPPIPPPPLQTSFDPLGAMPSAYDPTTPKRIRAASSSSVATVSSFGAAAPTILSPHAEEMPIPPTPLSAARVLERRDPKDDGFE